MNNEQIKQLLLSSNFDNIDLNQFRDVTTLDLGYSGFKKIDILINFSSLTHLNLSGCKIENIDSIYSLENLTNLDLSNNNIDNISSEIEKLSSLTHLNLAYNNLGEIPEELGALTNLTHLDFSDCSLKDFGFKINNLKKLEDLSLAYNAINILPDEIGELTCLKKLFLDGNQLKTLPQSIQKLTNLENDGGLWIWDMENLIIPDNLKAFIDSKIMVDYIFQLKLIKWACSKSIISKNVIQPSVVEYKYDNFPFYTPEDLQGKPNEEYTTEWERLLNDIASHSECPYEYLIQFYYSDYETYWRDNNSSKLKNNVLKNDNMKEELKKGGFGTYIDPKTNKIIAKINMETGELESI